MFTEIISDDRIEAAGDVRCGLIGIEDLTRYACALTPAKGEMALTVAEGRPPSGPTEVAVGATVLDTLGRSIGDEVTLRAIDGTPRTARIVGQSVGPMVELRNPGDGAHVSPDLLEQLAPIAEVGEFFGRFVGLRYAPGIDAAGFESELEAVHPVDFNFYSRAEPPSLLVQLERLRPLLVSLAVFFGAVGVVGLTHYLTISVRRRRGDFGVFRALGMRTREVARAVSWQGAIAAGIGLVAGVPLGIALGRITWRLVVGSLGIVVVPASPWVALATVGFVAIVGAALLGLGPGWWAARRSPAASLRAE
jgi:hypothetical protein